MARKEAQNNTQKNGFRAANFAAFAHTVFTFKKATTSQARVLSDMNDLVAVAV